MREVLAKDVLEQIASDKVDGVWHRSTSEVETVLDKGKLPPYSNFAVLGLLAAGVGAAAGSAFGLWVQVPYWPELGRNVVEYGCSVVALAPAAALTARMIRNGLMRRDIQESILSKYKILQNSNGREYEDQQLSAENAIMEYRIRNNVVGGVGGLVEDKLRVVTDSLITRVKDDPKLLEYLSTKGLVEKRGKRGVFSIRNQTGMNQEELAKILEKAIDNYDWLSN
jgi:hypothetical protein